MKLSGLSTPAFSKAVENISAIDSILSRNFKEGSWDKWMPVEGQNKDLTISISNRLFTPAQHSGSCTSEPIPFNVDPAGILQDTVNRGKLKYLEDNIVEYHAKVIDMDGSIRSASYP